MSHYAKNRREKKETTEPPPCVIYPKGGKGNARSKPEKGKGMILRPEIARYGSRLRKGKVLAPLTSVVLDGIHVLRKEKVAKHHTHTANAGGVKRNELDKVSHLMPTYLVWNKNQSHCSSAYARQTTQNNTNKQGWQTWSPTTTGWNYVGIRTKTHSKGQTWSPTANHWTYVGIQAKHTIR